MSEKFAISCPIFDGRRVWESATIVVEDGVISEETVFGEGKCDENYLLMPGLIDAHTHLRTADHLEKLLQNGVTTTCDVSAPQALRRSADLLNIWTSCSMALGNVVDGRAYVERMVACGADYIKVILEQPAQMAPKTMDPSVLREIVCCAHQHGLKVAAHAVTVSMVQMAVDAGVDILIHVPMKEKFPLALAEQIARQGIVVVPTLTMMKAFSKALVFGYRREHYRDAEEAVRLLRAINVPILTGTDSNDSFFAPKVHHGTAQHREMELLVQAGLTPLEVLQGATGKAAEGFGLDRVGILAPGYRADMVLVEGRPDRNITDSMKIKRVWVGGKSIL